MDVRPPGVVMVSAGISEETGFLILERLTSVRIKSPPDIRQDIRQDIFSARVLTLMDL